ncbi:hypothetical protein EYF80_006084 [Liparis tanakae]|uniref:Uncharacterized protein n=1 Tax=Liparis tanakae TaxID=230148 RepID=A0A4Z2J067_9TELE|nr:hypothetical protein EYF80_006084 [Liparis tanakae]
MHFGASAAERVHVLHDDKRRFLQSHDGQVILPLLGRRVQLKARPHVNSHLTLLEEEEEKRTSYQQSFMCFITAVCDFGNRPIFGLRPLVLEALA